MASQRNVADPPDARPVTVENVAPVGGLSRRTVSVDASELVAVTLNDTVSNRWTLRSVPAENARVTASPSPANVTCAPGDAVQEPLGSVTTVRADAPTVAAGETSV